MKKSLIKLSTLFIVCLLSPSIPVSTSIKNLKQEKKETSIIKRNVCYNENPLDILHKEYNIGNILNNDRETILDALFAYLRRTQDTQINIELYTFSVTHIQNNSAEVNVMNPETGRILFIITVNFRLINIANINNQIRRLESIQNNRENVILESVITQTNLGDIPDNSETTIHNFLQQRNPELISATEGVRITSITSNSAIITNFNYRFLNWHSRNNFAANIPITFNPRNQLLRTIITNTNLGLLENARSETIFNAIRQANENIPENFNLGQLNNLRQLRSICDNTTRILIELTSTSYQPEHVPFRIIRLDNINNFFTRPATQQEITAGVDIVSHSIRNRVDLSFSVPSNNINTNNSTNENNQEIEEINNEVSRLNFDTQQNNRENVILESVITQTNLGDIPDNSETTIHNFLQQRNPELISATEGVRITSITSNSAIITNFNNNFLNSHSRNNFAASIPITFNTRNQLLRPIVTNTFLGLLENARNETIFNAIREVNENIPENFNLGQLENLQRLWSIPSNAEEMIVSLVSDYQPQEVIYRIVRLDNINNSFTRPATQQEITAGVDILPISIRNRIDLIFLVPSNNTNANNSTNENNNPSNRGRGRGINNNNVGFCVDINTLKLRKRNIALSSNCLTVVNVFKIIDEYNQSENIKPGYIYLGTNRGVYLVNNKGKIVGKFKGIEDEIIDIKLNGSQNPIVATSKNEIYQLQEDWSIKKLDFESKDLNKGIELFLTDDKSNKVITTDWGKQRKKSVIIKNFNLGSLNPFDFTFIEFKMNEENSVKTRISWGNEAFYPSNNSDLTNKKQKKVNEVLLNFRSNETKIKTKRFFNDIYPTHLIAQKDKQNTTFTAIDYEQVIGLNAYWSNGSWHLQVVAHQECQPQGTWIMGAMFLNLGNRVVLYN